MSIRGAKLLLPLTLGLIAVTALSIAAASAGDVSSTSRVSPPTDGVITANDSADATVTVSATSSLRSDDEGEGISRLNMSLDRTYGKRHPDIPFAHQNNDKVYAMVRADGGGFFLAGWTTSYGFGDDDGNGDLWLVRISPDGTEQWNTTFGGRGGDVVSPGAVVQTDDGGIVLAGRTSSFDTDGYDGWLVKVASDGTEQWNTTTGGSAFDGIEAVTRTADGGYLLAGRTESFGAVGDDGWLVKVGPNGTHMWNKTIGGDADDGFQAVVQTTDEEFVLAGGTGSFDPGGGWVVRVGSNGSERWNTTLDGGHFEDVIRTGDGGLALAGSIATSGWVLDAGWLVKMRSDGTVAWQTTLGGSKLENAHTLMQTADGSFLVAGEYVSFRPATSYGWVGKTDPTGTEEWTAVVGGYDRIEELEAIVQTTGGELLLAGYTRPRGIQSYDGWFVQTPSRLGYTVSDTALAVNGTVDVRVTFESLTNETRTRNVSLFVDGNAVGNSTMRVNGASTDTERFTTTFTTAGTHTMSVNDVPPITVRVCRTGAGDANADGSVTAGDATLVLRRVVGLPIEADFVAACGDAGGDGAITSGDATLILRQIVGLT